MFDFFFFMMSSSVDFLMSLLCGVEFVWVYLCFVLMLGLVMLLLVGIVVYLVVWDCM